MTNRTDEKRPTRRRRRKSLILVLILVLILTLISASPTIDHSINHSIDSNPQQDPNQFNNSPSISWPKPILNSTPNPPLPPPPAPVSRTVHQFARPLPTTPPSPYAPYHHPASLPQPRELDLAFPKPTQPALVHQPGPSHALGKRWAGYATVTVFVNTVTVTAGPNPAVQVVTVTLGNDVSGPQGGGTVTVTVAGATQTVGGGAGGVVVVGPQATSTLFVTPTPAAGPVTIHTASTLTIAAGASMPTAATSADAGLPADRPCYPGEENLRYPGVLAPTNPTQTSTLFAIGVYFVFILVSWNLFIVRQIIYPIKLLVVAWHEFGHVVACACSGARLDSVTIDPNEGGATRMEAQVYPAAGLPAGYLSSFIFGGVMMFCGFDTLASKFVISIFIPSIATKQTKRGMYIGGDVNQILRLGLLIGFWFIDHAGILRYYVLFVGVMSSWYVLFDVMDDFVFRKMNPCCPVMFEERFPMVKAGIWALAWTLLAAINFVAWILLSLAVWRATPRGMFCQSQQFLPT
ncbi:hypothetical protein CROQUDRAFT_43843 [Cronartium quercuum f. sp. fusiforme G11]|uniref:Peptidase M50B-like-domain-containing protein n=1 Tax=Cronartium quercuum f. sp. fusiforme G11 TaxID=708437 RepID=A0A9P6TBY8_9BASI|nr:hypothetical protein CROQUDRAFT_43843 [Cronartium quercuum f. sp. fusiforme G11]